jgi:hypothetical protein
MGVSVVSPVELTKLGFKARIQKLGFVKYILIGGLLFLVFAGIEMVRYNRHHDCVRTEIQRDADQLALQENEIQFKLANLAFFLDNESKQKPIPPDQIDQLKKNLQDLAVVRQDIPKIIATAQEKCQSGYHYDIFRWFSWMNLVGTANAEIKIGGYSENDIRGMVTVLSFASMGVFFFMSGGALFFSNNPKVVAFAMDSVKTLLGFFIGVGMSFMGMR